MAEVLVTPNVEKLLRMFADDPARSYYTYDLMRATGLSSGVVYPIVKRLHDANVLIRSEETQEIHSRGARIVALYQINPVKLRDVRDACARSYQRVHYRRPGRHPLPALGTVGNV